MDEAIIAIIIVFATIIFFVVSVVVAWKHSKFNSPRVRIVEEATDEEEKEKEEEASEEEARDIDWQVHTAAHKQPFLRGEGNNRNPQTQHHSAKATEEVSTEKTAEEPVSIDLSNLSEVQKGIIYSEILKPKF